MPCVLGKISNPLTFDAHLGPRWSAGIGRNLVDSSVQGLVKHQQIHKEPFNSCRNKPCGNNLDWLFLLSQLIYRVSRHHCQLWLVELSHIVGQRCWSIKSPPMTNYLESHPSGCISYLNHIWPLKKRGCMGLLLHLLFLWLCASTGLPNHVGLVGNQVWLFGITVSLTRSPLNHKNEDRSTR